MEHVIFYRCHSCRVSQNFAYGNIFTKSSGLCLCRHCIHPFRRLLYLLKSPALKYGAARRAVWR